MEMYTTMMWYFKKWFCAKKRLYVENSSADEIFRMLDDGQKRELLQQKMLSDEMFQRELKSAYYRGYGEAEAKIFAAIQKEPDKYHEFIEKHRVETTANRN